MYHVTSDMEEDATHYPAATIPTFQSVEEVSLRMGTSTSKNESSQKFLQRPRHTSKAAKVVETKKRKLATISV